MEETITKKQMLWVLVIALMAAFLSGCKTKTVVMPEVHDVHHYHTDSILQRDSIFRDRQTTVMQLDSAAMAKYGIQLKSAERAWLVRTQELEYQLQRLAAMQRDSVHRVDSVPTPYPVEVKVPAELTWWQNVTQVVGGAVLLAMLVVVVMYMLRRKWPLL